MAASSEDITVLRPVQIVLNAAAGMQLQLLRGITGRDAVAISDQTDPDWMQIPSSEASLSPPCTDQNPSEPGEKMGWKQKKFSISARGLRQYLTFFHQRCGRCQPTAEMTWDFSMMLRYHFYSVQQQLGSFLTSCLKFLNISLSTAIAVSDDLKTAKKGGSTRGLYVTGFPCQIRLRACQ